MSGLGKVVRGLVGIAVIVVLIGTVNVYLQQYRAAQKAAAVLAVKKVGAKTGSSTESTAVVPASGQSVLILTSGVQLRSTPETSSKAIRVTKKGDTFILVGVTPGNWYQLRDPKGKIGFVVNNPTLVKLQK